MKMRRMVRVPLSVVMIPWRRTEASNDLMRIPSSTIEFDHLGYLTCYSPDEDAAEEQAMLTRPL
jgi:hypothetical protein